MPREQKIETYSVRFDSVDAALACATSGAGVQASGYAASRTGDAKWTGTASLEEAVTLAREGWRDGRVLVEDMATRIGDAANAIAGIESPQIVHGVAGAFVDVGAFLAGEPECMMSFEPVLVDRPIARILCNITYTADIGVEIINRRGAAIVALVDALESSGIRCEVESIYYATGRATSHEGRTYGPWEIRTVLKRADMPLQIDALSFAVAHPSSLRRIGFAHAEAQPEAIRNMMHVGTGYGSPSYDPPAESRADVIYLPAMMGSRDPRWSSEEAAAQWITGVMREQGVIE